MQALMASIRTVFFLREKNLPRTTRECCHCSASGYKYKKCAKCRLAFYCSPACQIKHWPTHKETCGTGPDLADMQSTIQKLVRSQIPEFLGLAKGRAGVFVLALPDVEKYLHEQRLPFQFFERESVMLRAQADRTWSLAVRHLDLTRGEGTCLVGAIEGFDKTLLVAATVAVRKLA
jgi:hypothetical protein